MKGDVWCLQEIVRVAQGAEEDNEIQELHNIGRRRYTVIVATYQACSFSQAIAVLNEWSDHILNYKIVYRSLTLTPQCVSPSSSAFKAQ